MGQYQEWLDCREVDQQLQAQLEALERELAQLQEHAHFLEEGIEPLHSAIPPDPPSSGDQVPLQINNQIINALITCLNGYLALTPASAPERVSDAPLETISPALFAWSNLPNFGPQEIPAGVPPASIHLANDAGLSLLSNSPTTLARLPDGQASWKESSGFAQARQWEKADQLRVDPTMGQPPPATPHVDMALLPEDMAAFFDQHDQTEPQLEIPRWLRNITHAHQPDGPIDKETMRTNRLVQRWVERWGQPPSGQGSAPGRAGNEAASGNPSSSTLPAPQAGLPPLPRLPDGQANWKESSNFAQPPPKEKTKEGP